MDWRLIVTVFVVSVGFAGGWIKFGTISGAVLSAVFVSCLFVVSWLIDKHVYNL